MIIRWNPQKWPAYHLEWPFFQILVTNRTLQNRLWCFIFWDIHIFRLNIQKNRENGHNMHRNGHIWYFLAIFVAGTFWPPSEHASCRMDALISPIWIFFWRFCCPKINQKLKKLPFLLLEPLASIWAFFESNGCAYFTHLNFFWRFCCPKIDQKLKKWPFLVLCWPF